LNEKPMKVKRGGPIGGGSHMWWGEKRGTAAVLIRNTEGQGRGTGGGDIKGKEGTGHTGGCCGAHSNGKNCRRGAVKQTKTL